MDYSSNDKQKLTEEEIQQLLCASDDVVNKHIEEDEKDLAKLGNAGIAQLSEGDLFDLSAFCEMLNREEIRQIIGSSGDQNQSNAFALLGALNVKAMQLNSTAHITKDLDEYFNTVIHFYAHGKRLENIISAFIATAQPLFATLRTALKDVAIDAIKVEKIQKKWEEKLASALATQIVSERLREAAGLER